MNRALLQRPTIIDREGTQNEGYLRVLQYEGGRRIAFGVQPDDAEFLVKAGNAYPKLVEAVASFLRAPSIGSSGPGSVSIEVQSFNRAAAVALLRELVEAS